MAFSDSLVFAVLLAVAVQAAVLPIVPTCKQKDEYWRGEAVYHYSYTTTVKSKTYKNDHDTGSQISCDVDLASVGQCKYILTTSNCILSTLSSGDTFKQHDKSDALNEHMSKYPVSFVMSDGEVHDLIVNDEEVIPALNVKRGIISALQGARLKHDTTLLRTDVHGACLTNFEADKNKIDISKNINKCHHPSQPDWELSPVSFAWNMSVIQSWLTNSRLHCVHTLSDSALESSECSEVHRLTYNQRTSEAKLEVVSTQKLHLKSTKDEKKQFDRNLRGKHHVGIVYEWEETPTATEAPENYKEKAYNLMNEMVSSTRVEIQPNTVHLFDELVHLLRNTPDVVGVTKGIAQCEYKSGCDDLDEELSISYIRDAVVTCNTEPCVKAASWLAINDHISNNYLNKLLLTWTKNKVRKIGYVDAIYDICKAKPSRTCVLSLTAVIHTYVQRQPAGTTEVPNTIKKAVALIKSKIPQGCIVDTEDEEEVPEQRLAVEKIILALKAIGNLGNVAIKVDSSLLDVIHSCIKNEVNPHNISVEAIKSLRRVSVHSDEVYDTLMTIIRDTDKSLEKRIVAYMVLTRHHHEDKLYDDLAKIIPKERNDQLGNFVAMHMNNIVLYGDSWLDRLKTSVRHAYKNHHGVFVVRGSRPLTSSRHTYISKSYDSADHDDVFGYDISSSAIYEPFSFLPQHVIWNLTTHVLDKTFNTATISAALHGLDPYLELFLGHQVGKLKTLKDRYNALQEHGYNLYSLFRHSDYTPHYDDKIEKRLTEIHNSVVHDYAKELPSGTLSIKRYGNEEAYTSVGLIYAKFTNFLENDLTHFDWHKKHSYRAHRLLRFLEAYIQRPLLNGLPLKWKSSATVALSYRLEGKSDPFSLMAEHPTFEAEWNFEPSAAVTVVNKMIVIVPHLTKFGARANFTLYHSRQKAASLKYENKEFSAVLHVPQRPQHILSVYHVRSLIRDGVLEGNTLPPRGKEDCVSDQYSGLKFCRYKYIANDQVPLSMSNMEYRVWYELADKGLREYKFNLKNLSPDDGSEKSYTFSFIAPGTKWQRKVEGRYHHKLQTNECDFQISVPEKPHVKFQGSRKRKADGYTSDLVIQLVEGKSLTVHGETTKKEHGAEAALAVKLSDRTYTWNKVYSSQSGNFEIDHYLTYETSTPKTPLRAILPDVFWENRSKAMLHLHISAAKKNLPHGFEHVFDSYIKLPKTILELKTQRISSEDEHNAIHLNLSRRHLPQDEIESLIYFNFDSAKTVTGDRTNRHHIAKLLIPKIRWTFEINRDIDPIDNNNYIVLRREKSTDGTLEVIDLTPVDKSEISLKINHHNTSRAKGENWPAPRVRDLEIVLKYPRDGEQQTFSYKGTITNDEAQKNAYESLQTKSHVESTYWKLKLDGKSNFIRNDDGVKLDHRSDITNVGTGNKATYELHLDYQKAFPIEFNQHYKSNRLTFQETLSVKRTATGIEGNLDITSVCPEWDFLDLTLKQKYTVDRAKATETVEFRHKYLDIDVKGEYKSPLFSDYRKQINIKSKNSIIPTTNINSHFYDNRVFKTDAEFPDQKKNIYSKLEFDQNYKGATYDVAYDHKGSEKIGVIDWGIHIVKPNLIVVNYTIDNNAIKRVGERFAQSVQRALDEWNRIKEDYDHPMNKYLRPLVKTTVGDYERELAQRRVQLRENLRNALREAGESLKPLIAPAAAVVQNILTIADKARPAPGESAIDKLVERYDLRNRVKEYFEELRERIVARLNAYVAKSRAGSSAIEHPLNWESLGQLPTPTPKLYRLLYNVPTTYNDYNSNILSRTREAVMFGGKHIYTFDGRYYKFPGFANDQCTYLLAHNFVTRQYSLLLQQGKLHLLLPDIAITLEKSGKVYLDKGKRPAILPVIRKHVTVTHIAHRIKVKTDYGLDLFINTADRVVLISISMWSHNKTLGLLGNNDNQPKNDFKLLDGRITDDLYELLSTYELTGNPECVDQSKLEDKRAPTKSTDQCSTYFGLEQHKSPLYLCFDIVEPEPFYNACKTDLGHGDSDLCSVSSAYSAICEKHGVPLARLPSCK